MSQTQHPTPASVPREGEGKPSGRAARGFGSRAVSGMRAPNAEEQASKRELLRALEADRARLLLHHPFTASLALHLKLVPLRDWRVPTAATDGEHIFFDVGFAQTLTPQERLFVLAHEVWHNAMDHRHRRGQRDRELWGLAADAEVNALLSEDGLQAPDHAVRFGSMAGRSAEQIYAWLRDLPASRRKGLCSFDVHDLQAGRSPVPQGEVEDPDFTACVRPSPDIRRRWQHNLASARLVAAQFGALPAGLARRVAGNLEPKVPWRQVLAHFLQRSRAGAYSWARVSRRHVWRSSWLPGRSEARLRIVVGIDTSGSTTDLQARFLSELKGIVRAFRTYELVVLECDATIHRETRLTQADAASWIGHVPKSGGLLGGGGTSFIDVFERAARENPEALVLFTDGHGLAPVHPPRCPVLWVLAGDGAQRPVPWGQCVMLSDDDRSKV